MMRSNNNKTMELSTRRQKWRQPAAARAAAALRRTTTSSHLLLLCLVLGVCTSSVKFLVQYQYAERLRIEQEKTAAQVEAICQKYKSSSSNSNNNNNSNNNTETIRKAHYSGLLDYDLVQQELCTAMDAVEPFVTSREMLEERWKFAFPLAKDYTIQDTMRIFDMNNAKQEGPERMAQQRVLYVVTPTYKRPSQMVDMVRLKQTLQLASLVKHRYIYWIVIEDAPTCTRRIRNLLLDSGLDFAHVAQRSIPVVPDVNNNAYQHKGVDQRNRALDMIEHEIRVEGVIYFADDDNAYDIQLFAELPATRQLSMWSVGFRGASRYQGCHVNPETNQIIDRIDTNLALGRKYPIDMAGFAFSTAVLLEKHVRFQKSWTKGHLESKMVESIVGGPAADDNHGLFAEIEPLAAGCTRILAWHVETGGVQMDRPNAVASAEFELLQRLI